MKRISYITALLFIISFGQIMAQENWEDDGEIEDVEIEIVKDRNIKLPHINRNFEKISPVRTNDNQGELEYFFNTIKFELPLVDLKLRPLRMKDQPLDKFYGNYVKVGFGNYGTPYFEGFVNNKRSKEYFYGAHVKYLNSIKGPVDNNNSGSGVFDIDLFGKLFGKKATLSGDLGYNRSNYHYYGYDQSAELDADTIKQVYNTVNIGVAVQNTKAEDLFQYKLSLKYHNLTDHYEAKEGEFEVGLISNYDFNDQVKVKLKSDLSLISRTDQMIDNSRTLFRTRPTVGFQQAGFDIEAGFTTVFENDQLGSSDELHFYPYGKASYSLNSVVEVYAGVRGDMEKQTFRTMVATNPYIKSNQPIVHNNKTLDFFGGVKGKLNNKIGFGAGLSIANYKNMHFFINDSIDQSKFVILYDTENTALVNVFGELAFADEAFRTTLRGDYFGYGTDGVVGGEAWHKPNYQVSVISTYNLYDKLLFEMGIYAYGGIKAYDFNTEEEINLDAAFDLNFKADYLISSQVSAFLQFNNILGQSYELYNRYPTRKLQFMAGVTYSF